MATPSQPAPSGQGDGDPKEDTSAKGSQGAIPVIVGLGASAGGLPALQAFFEALPKDTGMALVVIQHLAPDHESMLRDILARHTPLAVEEATEGRRVAANHIYIIPPDRNLEMQDGVLHLEKSDEPHARRLPVDRFFRALARDRGNRGIGVVLSGTGSDGTLGLRAIKEEGGITFAQDEASAQHPEMPRNAAHGGLVDFILPPQEIAAELARIADHPYLRQPLPEHSLPAGKALSQIFSLLQRHTGHDFSSYKPNTIKRRIQRRMSLNQLRDVDAYVQLLREDSREVESLFADLLINVTGFFRDPEAFESLKEHVFPALLSDRSPEQTLRIWVPGCSTGEEAYSVAMVLIEHLGPDWVRVPVQIFATDIDEGAINRARSATYPESIAADVSTERLSRFFTQVPGGYQINKMVRDLCVFALQDLAQDPPFSHLDLVCCRNVLIYLESDLQQRLLNIFHFALEPNGFLFLGKSETVGASPDLFSVVDQPNKIYSKRAVQTRLPTLSQPTPPLLPAKRETAAPQPAPSLGGERRLNRQASDTLLGLYAPPSVVVDADSEILTFLGETGPFIAPAPGRPSWNLYRVAHRDLAVPLRRALSQASETGDEVREAHVRFQQNGDAQEVTLRVRPLPGEDNSRHFLVIFEHPAQGREPSVPSPPGAPEAGREGEGEDAEELRRELETTRDEMQDMLSDHASTTEELQTANEEVQSANEELQSTNEELESAKEELQSTNEELATLNNELETRNQELSQANSDLQNLLRSINLPIVMVTEDLRIRQATPPAKELLNLLDSDVGRPLTDLRPRVEIPNLEKVIRGVIDSVAPRTMETQDEEGNWYSLSLRPYKDEDNRISGAVLVFYEITALKADPQQTRRLAAVAREEVAAILVADLNGAILTWNRGAQEHYGFTEQEARERGLWGLVPPEEHQSARDLLKRVQEGERVADHTARRLTKNGEIREVRGSAIPLRDPTGQVYAIALTERDRATAPESAT